MQQVLNAGKKCLHARKKNEQKKDNMRRKEMVAHEKIIVA